MLVHSAHFSIYHNAISSTLLVVKCLHKTYEALESLFIGRSCELEPEHHARAAHDVTVSLAHRLKVHLTLALSAVLGLVKRVLLNNL